jgi:hypothetical protein
MATSIVLFFSQDYYNSRQNIMILFRKYLADIRSEAWLNLFWEYINGKLFAVILFILSVQSLSRAIVPSP